MTEQHEHEQHEHEPNTVVVGSTLPGWVRWVAVGLALLMALMFSVMTWLILDRGASRRERGRLACQVEKLSGKPVGNDAHCVPSGKPTPGSTHGPSRSPQSLQPPTSSGGDSGGTTQPGPTPEPTTAPPPSSPPSHRPSNHHHKPKPHDSNSPSPLVCVDSALVKGCINHPLPLPTVVTVWGTKGWW